MLNKQFVDPPAVFLQQIFNNGKAYNLVDRLKSPLIPLSLYSLIKAPTKDKPKQWKAQSWFSGE